MAFVCPPKCDTEKRTELLTQLKTIITAIEDKLTPSVEPIYCMAPCMLPCGPCCVPCCPPCPPEENNTCEVPDTMICYKVSGKSKSSGKSKNKTNGGETINRVKKSSSRELRASILYVGCDCEKRDGLQDDCLRSDCQGSPQCLTQPPTCGPSEYCGGKHLGKQNYGNLYKNGKNGKNGNEQKDTNGDGGAENAEANYMCFPAKINPPKMCLPTCFVPIDCCPGCPGNNQEC